MSGPNPDGTPRVFRKAMLFTAPGKVTEFQLAHYGKPVARGRVP